MSSSPHSILLNQARQALAAENYRLADDCYTRLVNQIDANHPDYAECLENLVALRQEHGDFQAALDYCGRLIALGEEMVGADHPLVAQWRAQTRAIESRMPQKVDDNAFKAPAVTPRLPSPHRTRQGMKAQQVDTGTHVRPPAYPPPPSEDDDDYKDRQIRFSEQDMREQEEMYAQEIRSRNDGVLRMILAGVTTVVMVGSIYYCWSVYGQADTTLGVPRAMPAPDNVRYLRFLSTRTAQLGVADKSEKVGYARFGVGLDEFFRSLPVALFSKELVMQDKGCYIIDEDGTTYVGPGSAMRTTCDAMQKVSENCRIYYHRAGKYPRKLVDPDAGSDLPAANDKTDIGTDTASNTASGASSDADSTASASETANETVSETVSETANETAKESVESTNGPLTDNAVERVKPVYLRAVIDLPEKLGAKEAIRQTLEGLREGEKFPGETSLAPGMVSACHYYIRNKDKSVNDSLLVVHGADENGNLIRGSGVDNVFLYAQQNGTLIDSLDKTDPLGRSLFGTGARLKIRSPFLTIIECQPTFPLPLWALRFRLLIPALVMMIFYLVMRSLTTDRINKLAAGGLAVVSLLVLILSLVNAVAP